MTTRRIPRTLAAALCCWIALSAPAAAPTAAGRTAAPDAAEPRTGPADILQAAPVTVYNPDGTIGMQFQPNGSLILPQGEVVQNASPSDLLEEDLVAEWIVRKNATEVVARYDSGDGNLYLQGILFENWITLSVDSDYEFRIEFANTTAYGPRMVFDTHGNLWLSGEAFTAMDLNPKEEETP